MKSETTSWTSQISRQLAQFAGFVLSDYWPGLLAPNRSTLSPEKAFALIFFELVFLMQPEIRWSFISFVVMLIMEVSVKDSDGIKKDQINPLPTSFARGPMMLLGCSCWYCYGNSVSETQGLFTWSGETHCPGTTHWPRGQFCLGARSDPCNCSHEFFVAPGQLWEAGYPLYNTG